jgi:septal ring factor EnvC (AmiA/AmiB activator)
MFPRRLAVPALLILTLGLLAAPYLALAADDASPDKLKQVESEMAAQKKQAALLDQQKKDAADSLQDLRQKLINATAALENKEDEQQQVEDRLHGIEGEIADRQKTLAKSRRELSALTSVLIRLGQQPPETYFLRAGLTDDHIHQAILARALIPRLAAESESAARDLAVLADLRWMAGEQKRLVAASQQNLRSQQANLDQMIRARQGLLNQTEAQKAAIARQLVSLTTEAHDLHQLLAKVSPPGGRPKAGGVHPALDRPVAGTIIRHFGAKDADGIISQGLTFTALPGSPVVAPAAGRVVFAGPFRGYGQILILQHKDGYHSFLAGFGRIDAEMGQEVEAGEPLGILPAKDAGRPELYFEWRRNGAPVDPMEQKFRTTPASSP